MRNSKKLIHAVFFLVICLLCNSVMTFLIYPYNYARIDVHNIKISQYDTIFLGSSHGKCGINPKVVDEVTGGKSINVCIGGEYMQDVYFLAKEASRKKPLKKIVYELDPGYWVTEPVQGTDYGSFYQEFSFSQVKLQYFAEKMAKADFRSILFPWYVYRQQLQRIPENVKTKMSDVYRNYDPSPFSGKVQSYEDGGFIRRHVMDCPKTEENLVLWDETELKEDSMKYFQRLVKFCEEKEIELKVITTPVPDVTFKKYQRHFDDAHAFFSEYMRKSKVEYHNFNYIDMNGFDRSLDAFADYEGHMYGESADKFSRILAGYL